MNQQSNTMVQSLVPARTGDAKKRLPAPILLGRLKAERIEQPLEAVQVLEVMAGLPGWGLSPKAISLSRVFHFPSEEEAKAYSDFLFHMGRGLRVPTRVTFHKNRVYVTLQGRNGGIPPYLLDFAALLSQ